MSWISLHAKKIISSLSFYQLLLGLMAVPKQMGIPLVQHALKTDGTACDDGKKGDKLTDELDKTLGHLYWCVDAFKSHLKEGKGAPDWSM